MRAITIETVENFTRGTAFRKANTRVTIDQVYAVVYLHGNAIARRNLKTGASAGWETATTKERLNGIPGVHVAQHNHVWYLNGTEWTNSSVWTPVTL